MQTLSLGERETYETNKQTNACRGENHNLRFAVVSECRLISSSDPSRWVPHLLSHANMVCHVIWSAGTAGFPTKKSRQRKQTPTKQSDALRFPDCRHAFSGPQLETFLVPESKFGSGQLSHGVAASVELVGASFAGV